MTSPPPAFAFEKPAGDRLPYLAQIDQNTVLLRDGRLAQFIRLDGFLFETADTEEINYRKTLRDSMLQAIGTSRFALYSHVIRRGAALPEGDEFPDEFSASLDRAWTAKLGSRQLFVNDIVLTLVRRPAGGRHGIGQRIQDMLGGRRAIAAAQAGRAAELRALDAAREALLASLGHYGAHLLSTYETPTGPCSEPLEFLSGLYNGIVRPVRLPEGEVGNYLPWRRVSFGQRTVELSGDAGGPRTFTGVVSLKDYPGQTTPGMLDELLRLPYELTISQSFGFIEREAALGRVNLALRRMRAADDEAISLRAELSQARDDIAAGRSSIGEHHMTIAVHGQTEREVDTGVAEVEAALAELGLVAVREELGLEPAFWAQFPGNFSFITRRALVTSRNFASFASNHNFPIGRADGNHWGACVSTLETTAAGPYHFNFHQGDLGNFTIIGPSGSGKTVILNFLLAQSRRFDPRIIFFDKDRGAEPFLRAIGGRYDVLRPGVPSGLNPLQLPDTAENRRFLARWLERLVAVGAEPLNTTERARISDALDACMAAPAQYRRLAHLAELFRGTARPDAGDLYARLMPWWGNGAHSWLFDNPSDRIDPDARVIGFDMTRILDDPILRTPAMMYLFHRVEERLDGTPSIIVVDEGWKALDDPAFLTAIRDWEKTIRKRNGIIGFATQSAEDALSSSIASAIIEQAATQIFMANAKARAEDYQTGFGLTDHELAIVRALPDEAHAFLIKHGKHSVVARLNLSGERDLLTILSGRERTVRILDEVRAETGDDPAAWMPRLLAAA